MRLTILSVLIFAAVVMISVPVLAGDQIRVIAMDSPPGTSTNTVDVIPQTATMLSGVPAFEWYYGCSPTSAGMIFGYYDQKGYTNMSVSGPFGYDTIASSVHVADYWDYYGYCGLDPHEREVRADHAWECIGDYMGTNQWKWDFDSTPGRDFNCDGSTALFSYTSSGDKLYDYIPPASAGLPQTALCHGMKLFVESRGYQVVFDGQEYQNYTQNLDTWAESGGFSFNDWKAEINAGRPLMIGLDGHSMAGIGYDEVTALTVYFYDTWDSDVHAVSWGSSYGGMDWLNVTCIELTPIPEPTTMTLFGLGILTIVIRRRRRS